MRGRLIHRFDWQGPQYLVHTHTHARARGKGLNTFAIKHTAHDQHAVASERTNHLLPAHAVEGAVAVELEELLLQAGDLAADDALVALQLRLPGPAEAHAARRAAAW